MADSFRKTAPAVRPVSAPAVRLVPPRPGASPVSLKKPEVGTAPVQVADPYVPPLAAVLGESESAAGHRIVDLAPGFQDGDAVTLGQLLGHLGGASSAILLAATKTVVGSGWSAHAAKRITGSEYPLIPETTRRVYFDVYALTANASRPISFRLYDVTLGAAVAGTTGSTASTSIAFTRAEFTLPDATHDYEVQACITGGTLAATDTGVLEGAQLTIVWE